MIKQPVPVLSKKNVEFINRLITANNIDLIIEFGSGNSTIYFINKLQDTKITLLSVENTKYWFYRNISTITKKFKLVFTNINRKFWEATDYKKFYDNLHPPYTPIIKGRSRVEKWKRAMDMGPFFRFEKDSGSKFAGNFLSFRSYFILINKILRLLPRFRNERSTYQCKVNQLKFIYELVSPSMKDQFGESPNRDEYLDAGAKIISDKYKNILVMIDAGPRHYIADKLLQKDIKGNLHICLFDSHRPEYENVLQKYDGKFYPGDSCLIDGSEFYSNLYNNKKEMNKILSKELWYFLKRDRSIV